MEEIPQKIDISAYRYKLAIPQATKEAFLEALKKYNAMQKGDFRYLLTMRSLDTQGHRLDKASIKEALQHRMFELAGAVFGPARKLMWPAVSEYQAMVNNVRKHVITGYPESLSSDECRLMQDISEFYARLHVGQLTYALERLRGTSKGFWLERRMDIADIEKEWKRLLFKFDSPGASLGVGSRQATHLKDILFSLHEVLRFRLAWDAYPKGGMTVDFGTPMNWYKPVPLAHIEREASK